jgi:hypothetical protein
VSRWDSSVIRQCTSKVGIQLQAYRSCGSKLGRSWPWWVISGEGTPFSFVDECDSTDMMLTEGAELAERMRQYAAFSRREVRAELAA